MQSRKAAAAGPVGFCVRKAPGARVARGVRPLLGALLAEVLLAAGAAGQQLAQPQTTFRPVSAYGASQNAVFMNTFWWTMGILTLVVVLTLYAAWRFRERPDSPEPEHIHGNTTLEITWTLVPAIIVVMIAIPTIRTIFENQAPAPDEALEVQVIGHQWWWEFRYPEQGITTANQLYLPVGRPVDLQLHSADVIHSFWIPRIGGKRDVNPQARPREGENPEINHIVVTIDSAGHYPGQCAEYCGDSHAIMQMSVVAVPQAEFDAWVAAMRRGDAAAAPPASAEAQPALQQASLVPTTPSAAQLNLSQIPAPTGIGSRVRAAVGDEQWAVEGRKLFLSKPCAACHAITGTTAQGAIGPNLTRFGARPSIGAGALDNTIDNLMRWIRDPQAEKPGALMPGAHHAGGNFPPTNLSEAEIRAIASYLLSLK